MKLTRRRFLEGAGAVAAGSLVRPARAAGLPQAGRPLSGAPGVELNVDGAALPDYSRDLERYLVRLSNEARERRKRVIDAISTRAGSPRPAEDGRRGALEDARRPARAHSLNAARHRHRRAAGLSNREADVREPAAALRHGEPLCACRDRDVARRFSGRSDIRRMARRGQATRSCSRTWRARATSSSRTTRSGRVNASSIPGSRPGQSAIRAVERASTSTPDAA